MALQKSVSIVVPALNEERNLERAITDIFPAVERHFDDYEILVFNDGSSDRTGEIADELARRYPQVQAIHSEIPQNIGGVIKAGLQKATKHWFIWVDGKGATPTKALDAIFSQLGKADLIVPYTLNEYERSIGRRLVHNLYVGILNLTFNLDLKAYNHLMLCRREDAKRFAIHTLSYSFQSEQLIKLIRSGASYVQVGVYDRFDNHGRKSKVFKAKNVVGVARFYLRTLYEVYVLGVARQPRTEVVRPVAAAVNPQKPG